MVINIVAGSPNLNIEIIKKTPADCIIGVDYGAYYLISHQLKMDIAFGDFDSITNVQLEEIKKCCQTVYVFNQEKDETDTELALKYALDQHPTEINLFGVTGKRLDHFLGTLNLYKMTLSYNTRLNIIDGYNKMYLLKPGSHTITKSAYRYISFFSYRGVVEGLTLRSFKYELTNYTLNNENSLTISNEIIDTTGTVTFNKGLLLIVESSD